MGIEPRDIIEHMQVTDRPGLYVVGAFEPRVTVYSQQVRALNLVYSLSREGWLGESTKVAVIGAGVAGITAAAAAGFCKAKVTVLERLSEPLSLIGKSEKRWLHPHIYEWPVPKANLHPPLDDDAHLPLLNWRAGSVRAVRDALLGEYERFEERFGIERKINITNVRILPSGSRRFSLLWSEPVSSDNPHAARRDRTLQCDIVILALGFGLERRAEGIQFLSYWSSDKLEEEDASIAGRANRILVSGTGDGGLIDLLRIRIKNFSHHRMVELLTRDLLDRNDLDWLTDELKSIERRAERAVADRKLYQAELYEEYQTLRDELARKVEISNYIKVRPDTQAVLTGKDDFPLSLRASILNRLLYMMLPDRRYEKGPWTSQRNDDGSYTVTFDNGSSEVFDEIIIRHGPEPALKRDFPEIWEQCSALRLFSTLDQTRYPIYKEFFNGAMARSTSNPAESERPEDSVRSLPEAALLPGDASVRSSRGTTGDGALSGMDGTSGVSSSAPEGRQSVSPFETASGLESPIGDRNVLSEQRESAGTSQQLEASVAYALVRLGTQPFTFRRKALTDEVLRLVCQETSPIVLLQGLAGSGKRTLLGDVTRELAEEFPYALIIKFDGPAALEPIYFLEEINDLLIALGRGIAPERLQEQNLQSTVDTLITQLSDLRLLVLLLSVDSVRPSWLDLLLQRFVILKHVRVIATALTRPLIGTQATIVSVPPLSDTEAISFARKYASFFNLDADPEGLLKRLPASVWSNPQALTTILAQLRDVPSELLLFEGIPEDAHAPVRVIEQAISRLNEEEQKALALTDLFAEMELAKVIRTLDLARPAGLLTALRSLASKSLIYLVGEAYAVPATVNEALGAAASGPRDEAASTVGCALQQAIANLPNPDEGLGTLAAISARIAQRFNEQGRWDFIHDLIDERYLELLNARGLWKEYSLLLRVGAEAAAKLNDELASFHLCCRLARKLLQMGEDSEAYSLLQEIAKSQIANAETLDAAELHSHRALLFTMSGKDENALQELAESHRIRIAMGDSKGLAITENLTGNIHLRRKEFAAARQAYGAALARFTEEGMRYLVDAETGLALCDLGEGLNEEAEARLRQAMTHCQQLNYDTALPRVLYHLALVLESRGQSEEAVGFAREAAEKSKSTDPRLAVTARLLAQRLEMMNTYYSTGTADEYK